jgi:hypothetical protein
MCSIANFYKLPTDSIPELLDQFRPEAGEFKRPSWSSLKWMLEAFGQNQFAPTTLSTALEDIWSYADTVCSLNLSRFAEFPLARELANFGCRGFTVPHAEAAALSIQLNDVRVDEQEMRLLLEEMYESDARCDVEACAEALRLLQSVLDGVEFHEVAIIWFDRE